MNPYDLYSDYYNPSGYNLGGLDDLAAGGAAIGAAGGAAIGALVTSPRHCRSGQVGCKTNRHGNKRCYCR